LQTKKKKEEEKREKREKKSGKTTKAKEKKKKGGKKRNPCGKNSIGIGESSPAKPVWLVVPTRGRPG